MKLARARFSNYIDLATGAAAELSAISATEYFEFSNGVETRIGEKIAICTTVNIVRPSTVQLFASARPPFIAKLIEVLDPAGAECPT